jgi:hypothetical protein
VQNYVIAEAQQLGILQITGNRKRYIRKDGTRYPVQLNDAISDGNLKVVYKNAATSRCESTHHHLSSIPI